MLRATLCTYANPIHGDNMFSRHTPFVLVISGLALSACQPKAENARLLSDADRNEMRAVVAEFDKAVLAANWPKVVSFYSEDGILLPPNGPAVQGQAAMQKFFEGLPRITEIKQSIPEIEGNADLASVRGTYDMTMIPPGAKVPLKDTGKSLAVWRKQTDGSWRVRRVSWNSDFPTAR
jgi:uncharacterized protein (TIGR02246 family)